MRIGQKKNLQLVSFKVSIILFAKINTNFVSSIVIIKGGSRVFSNGGGGGGEFSKLHQNFCRIFLRSIKSIF